MNLSTLFKCDVIILGRNAGNTLTTLAHFKTVSICKGNIGAEDGRVLIKFDEISKRIINISEISEILLMPVNHATDCVWPATISR